jgi:hypothetical protein
LQSQDLSRRKEFSGATDEIGLQAAEDKVDMHDLHAALLGSLGLDHERLTYFFQGREFRLPDVGGEGKLLKRLRRV